MFSHINGKISPWPSLVPESIAYPYMDFQKPMDINMRVSMIRGCQSSIIHTSVDIHNDTQAGISMQGHSAMDIRKKISIRKWVSIFYGYQSSVYICFYEYQFGYPLISVDIYGFLWISMDFYGYPCIDLLWILNLGELWVNISPSWKINQSTYYPRFIVTPNTVKNSQTHFVSVL